MPIDNVTPASGSIVATGERITIQLTSGDGLTSLTHARVGTGETSETIYTSSTGFEPGFTGSYSSVGGVVTIAFRRDAGWSSSPFRIDALTSSGTHSVSFRLQAEGQYPQDMVPFNEPVEGTGTVERLDDIGDVAAANPSDDEVLGWDNSAGQWTPRPADLPGPHYLSSHIDVSASNPTNEDVLTWNGTNWVNEVVVVKTDSHGIGAWAYGNSTIGATTAAGAFDVNNAAASLITEIQFNTIDGGQVNHDSLFSLIDVGAVLIFRRPRNGYDLIEFEVTGKSGTTYPKFTVQYKSATQNFTFGTSPDWSVFPVTVGGEVTATVPTLAQVIEDANALNQATVPSSQPIVLTDATGSTVPLSLSRATATGSAMLNVHSGDIRVSSSLSGGYASYDYNKVAFSPGFAQETKEVTAGSQAFDVTGDDLVVSAGSHAGAQDGGDLLLRAGSSVSGTNGAIRVGDSVAGAIYMERGFYVKETASEPEADQANMGQFWTRSSDGKPMFTDNAGTAYDLTAGVSAGVSDFNTRTGSVTPQAGDYTAAMVSAAPDTHVGAGGASEHPDATISTSGFMSAADKTAHNDLVSQAIRDSDFPGTDAGFMHKTGSGAYESIKSNLSATVDPVPATDHSGLGYGIGSRWINTTTEEEFVCVDAANPANWLSTTAGTGGSGTLAGLTDVSISSPLVDQILAYDDGLGQWINQNPPIPTMTAFVQPGDPGGASNDGDFWIQTP